MGPRCIFLLLSNNLIFRGKLIEWKYYASSKSNKFAVVEDSVHDTISINFLILYYQVFKLNDKNVLLLKSVN